MYPRCPSAPATQSRHRALYCLHHSGCGRLIDASRPTFGYRRAGLIAKDHNSVVAVRVARCVGLCELDCRIDHTRPARRPVS